MDTAPSDGGNKWTNKISVFYQFVHAYNRRWLIIFAFLLLIFFIAYHYISKSTKKPSAPAVEVITATAQSENVPLYLLGLGTVTPFDTVTVKSEINGQLLRVLFKEGQMVKAGELIAQIDPRPFLAQLTQDEAQLERDQALLANAKIDLARYKVLWKQDSVSQQILATQVSLVKQYGADIQLDQGLIESTKVNLGYCNITSPVNGRIGLRVVDPGNFVQTTDTNGIAVITTLQPISVIFSLPEDDIPQILKQIDRRKILTALAYDRTQTKLLSKGTLLTLDNEIDPTTGTVKLKAKFTNKDDQLFPNQFVNIKLLIDTLKKVVVVPAAAIQRSTNCISLDLI